MIIERARPIMDNYIPHHRIFDYRNINEYEWWVMNRNQISKTSLVAEERTIIEEEEE